MHLLLMKPADVVRRHFQCGAEVPIQGVPGGFHFLFRYLEVFQFHAVKPFRVAPQGLVPPFPDVR